MIQVSPDGRWLLGTDLGRDRLLAWSLVSGTPQGAAHELALSPGSGPRHFAFHADDPRWVYVLQEESSTLSTVELTPTGPRLHGEISVLPAPGHTAGSVLLSVPTREHPGVDRIVFSGDVVFAGSVGRTDLPGGDQPTMLRSLREVVLALPERTALLPGHGPQTSLANERLHNPYLQPDFLRN